MTEKHEVLLLLLAQTVRSLAFAREDPDAAMLERLDRAVAETYRPEQQHTISRGNAISARYHSLGKRAPDADSGDAA